MTSHLFYDANFLGYIEITGEGAAEFLQGQLTVNVNDLQNGVVRLCAQCDAKGKMVGLGFLFKQNETFYFVQDKSTIEDSLAQLKKFGVFAKVTFSLSSTDLRCVACDDNTALEDDLCRLVSPSIAQLDNVKLLWTASLDTKFNQQITHSLNTKIIKNGVPLLKTGMTGEWVPQMLNVQALNGIDFDKGCYMGQETVARTRYLGKNKRALYTYICATNILENELTLGAHAYRKMGENWRKSGVVINTEKTDGEILLSVVMPNDIGADDVVSIDDTGNILLTPIGLPYVIESDISTIKQRKRSD